MLLTIERAVATIRSSDFGEMPCTRPDESDHSGSEKLDLAVTLARLAFALWYLMAMEESSTALARDLTRNPRTATLGEIEPAFVALHREHMKDELRHLQVDGILAELCLARAGRATRALNATLFKTMLGIVTRPTRAGSGVKVIRELIRQMPELSWRVFST